VAAATEGTPGDGSNAAQIAALATDSLGALAGQSLTGFYNAIASDVAVKGAAAMAAVEVADAVTLSLTAQRESVSGVSLDEETISLLRLERAFQGAARYASVVDQLIQEMLGLVG
jgi:flagellar hook-associated protein 1 FlgK